MNRTDRLLRFLPAKERIAQFGAVLPPALRCRISNRFFSAIARRASSSSSECLETNMGISSGYRCRIPRTHATIIFGKPSMYAGERAPLELAATLSLNADAFVDIGCNVGYFTFYMRHRLPLSKPIYFFEPDPDLYALVEENVGSNALSNVYGFRAAIGHTTGRVSFYKNLSDSLSGSLVTSFVSTHRTDVIEVNAMTFCDFVNRTRVNNACVKVDIEGAELQFIDGAAGAVSSISSLIIEVLAPAIKAGFVQKMIKETGFSAYYINDFRLEHSMDGSFVYSPPQYNWLFCRSTPRDLKAMLSGTRFQVVSRDMYSHG